MKALRAVDDIISVFRLLAREVALEHGIVLKLSAQAHTRLASRFSGMHIQLFIYSTAAATMCWLLNGTKRADHMSNLARGCVSGACHTFIRSRSTAPPLQLLRLQKRLATTASLFGIGANWGGDHRNVTNVSATQGGAVTV